MARQTLQSVASQLGEIRTSAIQRGVSLGFQCFDNEAYARTPTLSIKKGYPVYVAALPHSGKSEFVFELLINLSQLHGWRHCIYSGEEGDAAEVYVQIIEKVVGKQFRNYHAKGMVSAYAMTEAERVTAELWVNDHFFVIDDTTDYTPEAFCAEVDSWERELGFQFDTMTFDPFNDFARDDDVAFGGIKVGGIRISHMSNIERDMSMALTVSKAQRKPYTVRVLAVAASPADRINAAQTLDELAAVWKSLSADEKVAATEAKDKRKVELTTVAQ